MEQYIVTPIRRYFDLELPTTPDPLVQVRNRWPLLIALHGYQGDKASMMRVARRIAGGKMVVIALQAPYQFFVNGDDPNQRRVGYGWGTTWKMEESVALHQADILELVGLAARKYRALRSHVFLLAFSQACSYNYRFVFTHPRLVRGAIGVCGGAPGDWNENKQYKPSSTHVLHIAATRDQWFSRDKNLEIRRKLGQRAASLDFRFYNSPHKFPRASIPHIRKWIEKHL